MPYRLLADATVLLHMAFVAFVVLGGLLVFRWPKLAWVHLPAAAWGAWVEFAGTVCPLTPLENWFRARGGQAAYTTDFIDHYLMPVLYPAALSRERQWALGGIVLVVNAGVYFVLLRRRARGRATPAVRTANGDGDPGAVARRRTRVHNPLMRAMLLDAPGRPLRLAGVPRPTPGAGELLLRVKACAVCRTDLHVVDGELPDPSLPLIPGHEIVGVVVEAGPDATRFAPGTRVGVPWLGWTCGTCTYCRSGAENLCATARFTGYTRHGGYAEYTVADQRYCFALPDSYDDVHAAPLLCAGLIGHRAYRVATEGALVGGVTQLGLYGFGAAAHLLAQVAVSEGRSVYAFTRPGDAPAQAHARGLGAVWAGGSDHAPPEPLDAAILFAPVGALVPAALRVIRPGGVVVCAGIHMSDIPAFPYSLLWQERVVRSVANLTRKDGEAFLMHAARTPLRVDAEPYRLEDANAALDDLREGRVQGAAVLVPGP